jgi:hypothetical protein
VSSDRYMPLINGRMSSGNHIYSNFSACCLYTCLRFSLTIPFKSFVRGLCQLQYNYHRDTITQCETRATRTTIIVIFIQKICVKLSSIRCLSSGKTVRHICVYQLRTIYDKELYTHADTDGVNGVIVLCVDAHTKI